MIETSGAKSDKIFENRIAQRAVPVYPDKALLVQPEQVVAEEEHGAGYLGQGAREAEHAVRMVDCLEN